ncbi:MAG: hypothetical protein Q4C00_01480 [Bacillota bacterium]|nr:hypothetical protein [Bacillota bacterium]
MLKLINIKRNDEYIEAEYLPEDSKEKGYVKVNIKTKKIVDSQHSKYEEPYENYSECRRMAANGLLSIADDSLLPQEKLVMWY